MTKTLHAVFDGKVLRPEESVDLEVGKRYILSVERTIEAKATSDFLDTAYGVIDALTTDEHFQQAGFRALLLQEI